MDYKDRDGFLKLAGEYNLIPLCRTLNADTLTPVLAMSRLGENKYSFLLESVVGGEKIGRFSFLGSEPTLVFKATGKKVEITDLRGTGRDFHGECDDPLAKFAKLMDGVKTAHDPALPRFCGGLVGYAGYDAVRLIEHLPNKPERTLGLPDVYFGLYNHMLVFDHVKRTVTVVVHADLRGVDPEIAYRESCAEIERMVKALSEPRAIPLDDIPPLPDSDPECESNFEKEDFKKAVEGCREYIRAGDIFQVVLSQRLSMKTAAEPFSVYRSLRSINPSPYMLYLKYPELTLVGSSPEVMVRLEEGKITLRPIAGTRPRGKTEEEDKALAADLLADEKELAEHAMLLDLGRNDVGRVSEYGSVDVTEKMIIENYSHVMHIVSNVEGKIRDGYNAFDTLKACLPAGTVSGAPKVRAMEIIDEFEPDARGPYAGAVGYIDFSGNLDTCIALRTVVMAGGTAYVQAGAGLVLDSDPEKEYQETRSKARALLRAIAAAGCVTGS